MKPQTLARQAYAQASAPTRTPRDAEYEVISRITYRLKTAAAQRDIDFGGFAAALHENRRLWTVLAAGVADAENRLPVDLRARIFYLAEFTRQHSSRVLGGKAPVEPLLDINTAVLRGLRQAGSVA
ncbi:flagellar biosynthesis regulator FlaF [Ruegeria sediminis]|uniref:Flagellar biosynthesis regulator FlaF n=1 Tax=Ruegeria sediminis TaxID=2583820 RepID=A0ABY2WUL4_9RHOB|nr:flagellar biosynthesis regulator FlaF [Ruegeria sediminis]TMV04916.1 flagellar biosynthesis regulator FlaF [Ruegeria sediminis]